MRGILQRLQLSHVLLEFELAASFGHAVERPEGSAASQTEGEIKRFDVPYRQRRRPDRSGMRNLKTRQAATSADQNTISILVRANLLRPY
jgi:hypothetical protein